MVTTRSVRSWVSSCRALRVVVMAPPGSVGEGRGRLVADPVPQRDGALHLGTGDERGRVELLGVEADRADEVAAAGALVPLDELLERRAALAGGAEGGARDSEADGFLGEEHDRLAA